MTTNGEPGADVGRLLAELCGELGEVSAVPSASGTEFRRGSTPFAVRHGRSIALRLRPDIAEAALHTPGTSASARGDDWIEFEPDPSNPQDVDRLRAWLTIGWRSAQRHN